MREINFVVMGNPKAQSRPRFFRRGNFVGTYDKDKQDKKDFAAIASYNAPREPLGCPVIVCIDFWLKRPKSHYGTGRNSDKLKPSSPGQHIKKPDVDNLGKLAVDALTGLFWKDDCQIVNLDVTKQYGDPRTEIKIKYY